MAEAVKNNSRKRRPPSHLYEGYNEDNFEPGNNQHMGTREQNRQAADPFTISAMARLLAKFINSANKKSSELRIKKQEQQAANSLKRQAVSEPKLPPKTDRGSKQDRQTGMTRPRETEEGRQSANRQELSKQRYQQKNFKKVAHSGISSSVPEPKKQKAPVQVPDSLIKSSLQNHDLFSIQSMAKISREQLFKMLPKGTDPNLFKEQLMQSAERNFGRPPMLDRISPTRPNQFRQDTKLFKRASFHIGIAYNIHIDTIKQKNPQFSQEELDPTYVSRKLKQESSQLQRRQNEEKARQELLLRQRQQAAQSNRQKQKNVRAQPQQRASSKPSREPICIDIDDESQPRSEPAVVQPPAMGQQQRNPPPESEVNNNDLNEVRAEYSMQQEHQNAGSQRQRDEEQSREQGKNKGEENRDGKERK